MIRHTILPVGFDSDGEQQFQIDIWITEMQNSNLNGIEPC